MTSVACDVNVTRESFSGAARPRAIVSRAGRVSPGPRTENQDRPVTIGTRNPPAESARRVNLMTDGTTELGATRGPRLPGSWCG